MAHAPIGAARMVPAYSSRTGAMAVSGIFNAGAGLLSFIADALDDTLDEGVRDEEIGRAHV